MATIEDRVTMLEGQAVGIETTLHELLEEVREGFKGLREDIRSLADTVIVIGNPDSFADQRRAATEKLKDHFRRSS